MKDLDRLRIQQLDEMLAPLRILLDVPRPRSGWAKAIRDALGLTNVQLSRRLNRKASQTIEDILKSEAAGTVKLNTLQELANAMNCRLVYALVPEKSLEQTRRDQAVKTANSMLKRTSHTMRLEDQGLTAVEHERAVLRQVDKLLSGSPRKLWQ